jgi:hypothetical protein
MLDHDLTFAMTVFAAIAALVVYITQRAKRTIKPKGKPLNIQKMPGAPAEATHQGSALEEWNFPRPIEVLPDPNDSVELESMPQTMPRPPSCPAIRSIPLACISHPRKLRAKSSATASAQPQTAEP